METKEKTATVSLVEKIGREYETMRERWWDMTADELVNKAEDISAAKFIKENIGSCVNSDEAEYLLSIKEPLAAIMETIRYRYDVRNIAECEWFSEHLYDLCDKRDLDADVEFEESESSGMTMK